MQDPDPRHGRGPVREGDPWGRVCGGEVVVVRHEEDGEEGYEEEEWEWEREWEDRYGGRDGLHDNIRDENRFD